MAILIRQRLDRRIDAIEMMRRKVTAWNEWRDNAPARIDGQFNTVDAPVKLKRLYPTLDV